MFAPESTQNQESEMKIVDRPTVYLVGVQYTDDDEMKRFLVDHEIDGWTTDAIGSDKLCEVGGRLCYLSFAKSRPGGNAAYLKHIKEMQHGSVLEHAVFSVIAVGVSRSLSHEWVRHRAGMSPSQLSQRYVSESRGEFVIPREIQGDGDMEAVWVQAVQNSWLAYKRLVSELDSKIGRRPEYHCSACMGFGRIDGRDMECEKCHGTGIDPDKRTEVRKAARGAARSVLPNATETKIMVTGNARAWRHFFEMRASPAADAEIRLLAYTIWAKLVSISDALFGDYQVVELPDGTHALETPYRKV